MKHNKFFKLLSVMLLIVTLLISSTAFAFADTKDNWVQKAPMITPREKFETIVTDSKIYAIGGDDVNNNYLSTVEEYDLITNTWTKKASMKIGRIGFQAVLLNDKIYIIGGRISDSVFATSSVEEYDIKTDKWTDKKALNIPRAEAVAKVVDGKIYIIGGYSTNSNGATNSVEVYNPKTDEWTTCAPMLYARLAHSGEVVNGKIYIAGGVTNSQGTRENILKTIEEYDPKTNKWTEKASMSTNRAKCQTQVFNNQIYIIGGYTHTPDFSEQVLPTVEAYDPQSNTCIPKTSMLHQGTRFSTMIAPNHIFAIDNTTQGLEEYDPLLDKWTVEISSQNKDVLDTHLCYVKGRILDLVFDVHDNVELLQEYDTRLSTPTLTVTASPNKVKVGQQFTTDVAIHNVTNVCAEDVKIVYDKDLFEYEGATGQTGTKIYKEDTSVPGTVRFITACQGKDTAATGDKGLITLKFKAKKQGVGKVDIVKGRIADNATLEEDVADENCGEDTITVDGYADVNRTGNFTLLDLGIDAYYDGMNASDTDSTKYDADIVPDGKIDDNDLAQITQEILANKDYAPNN